MKHPPTQYLMKESYLHIFPGSEPSLPPPEPNPESPSPGSYRSLWTERERERRWKSVEQSDYKKFGFWIYYQWIDFSVTQFTKWTCHCAPWQQHEVSTSTLCCTSHCWCEWRSPTKQQQASAHPPTAVTKLKRQTDVLFLCSCSTFEPFQSGSVKNPGCIVKTHEASSHITEESSRLYSPIHIY